LVGIDHVGNRHGHHNPRRGLTRRRDRDRLTAHPRRRRLADNHKADRPDRRSIDEIPDQHQHGLRPGETGAGGVVGRAVDDADDDLEDGEHSETGVVDCSAANVDQEDPGEAGADEAEGEEANAHAEGVIGGEAGYCEGLVEGWDGCLWYAYTGRSMCCRDVS
jgi:hypothetical protein